MRADLDVGERDVGGGRNVAERGSRTAGSGAARPTCAVEGGAAQRSAGQGTVRLYGARVSLSWTPMDALCRGTARWTGANSLDSVGGTPAAGGGFRSSGRLFYGSLVRTRIFTHPVIVVWFCSFMFHHSISLFDVLRR